jgi:hypothetical protein
VLHSGKASPSVLGSSPSAFDTRGRGATPVVSVVPQVGSTATSGVV